MTEKKPYPETRPPAAVMVRRGHPEDADAMAELVRRAYEPYVHCIGREPAPMNDDYISIAREDGVWLAERDNRLVGLVVLQRAENHLLVQNVAVAPEAQGQGIGGLLLQLAEEQARILNLSELRLYTNEAMEDNLHDYSRHGYQETHRTSQDGYKRVFFSKWPIG